jgi:rSAM/selenodomain-associated transferase 1
VKESGCIVVFTKPAVPGRVKTRLIGALSPQQTASLHEAFLEDLVARLRGGAYEVWLAWALDGGAGLPATELPSLRQHGEDLGERLFRALTQAAESHRLVAAVGSDHPEMPVARVDEAFSRLAAGADFVFGPAADGGYYLVAASRASLRSEVFAGIPWSTEAVLTRTLERCEILGLRVEMLPMGNDVDTPADLPRLGSYLRDHPQDCPRTRSLLLEWGLLATP